MDPLTLTAQLNTLLQAIHLPFVLETPVDLTPSLLIAILESILNVRIPIAHASDEDDKNNVADGRASPSQNRHIQTIKIFLGVLETDILQIDVGLSKLDPRLLAAGAWDEVVYVAEVLCWIGEELGLIQPAPVVDKGKGKAQDYPVVYSAESTSLAPPYLPKAPTPSPSSTITFLPPFNDVSPPQTPTTTTLLFSTDVEDHTLQTNITSPLATSSPLYQLPSPSKRSPNPSPYTSPNPRRKAHTKSRSTHLSPTSSTTRSNSHSHSCSSSFFSPSGRDIPPDDSSFSRQTPPIRKTGYISLVDHDAELSSFLAHSLSLSSSSSTPSTPTSPRTQRQTKPKHKPKALPTPSQSRVTALTSPPTFSTATSTPRRLNEKQDWRTLLSTSPDHNPRRTYELLQQRTQLMEELLRIRMSQRRPFR